MSVTATDPIADILSRMANVKKCGTAQWEAKCPSHDDRRASLSISKGSDGRVLLHCHAGCSVQAICSSLGIATRDLFLSQSPSSNGHAKKPRGRLVRAYDYVSGEGELVFQSCRYDPKGFSQRQPDGRGGWIWNLKGVRRVLYRLPELNEADPDAWVFVVEGEKDVDRLMSLGLVATTNAQGAGHWLPEYNESLRARRVAILIDNDDAGGMHGQKVSQSLHGIAGEIKIILLPDLPPKGDVSDWLDRGGDADGLLSIVENAPTWAPEADSDSEEPTEDDLPRPIKLGELWRSDPELREPVLDGLLRRGQVGNLISTSKSYKTYLILSLAISNAVGRFWLDAVPTVGGRTLIIDMELQRPDITKRTHDIATAMHAPMNDVAEYVEVQSFRGQNATIDKIEPMLLKMKPREYSLVILDPLYKLYPNDFDENSNAQMTGLYRRFERIAEHLDAALLIVHHASKGSQAEKRVIDVGAGAGAQARAPDCHIALREHEVDGCVVMDAKVRSFRPPEPVVLRWEYPLWTRDLSLDPEDLKTGRRSRNTDKPEPLPKEKPKPWDVDRFVEALVEEKPKLKDLIVEEAQAAGLSLRRANVLLNIAISQQKVFKHSFVGNLRTYFATKPQELFNEK